ncbi:MAG: hypothetical protein H0V82_06085 [Candidatus Protochlamydia sp.]|nr:hypothetical protein [Candidatus Protochlamydia sp.]
MHRFYWFHFAWKGVLTLFFSLMLYVTIIAFTRRSGSTGLDMAKMQKIRYEAFMNDAPELKR